jgi:3-deoxy-D-manno-octulosonic-acid transferase
MFLLRRSYEIWDRVITAQSSSSTVQTKPDEDDHQTIPIDNEGAVNKKIKKIEDKKSNSNV